MSKYLAIYKGKRIIIESDTIYHAQLKAAAEFKAKHSYDVDVFLQESNGQPVVHSTCELPG